MVRSYMITMLFTIQNHFRLQPVDYLETLLERILTMPTKKIRFPLARTFHQLLKRTIKGDSHSKQTLNRFRALAEMKERRIKLLSLRYRLQP